MFAAKAEADSVLNREFDENLSAKLALLDEAEPLLKATDHAAAKRTLADIQRRWDEIGRVPRDKVRSIEDRLRKVEAVVRNLDAEHWRRTDPERKARSEGLAGQLTAAIAQLEADLETARASGDSARIAEAEEALAARRSWLDALR